MGFLYSHSTASPESVGCFRFPFGARTRSECPLVPSWIPIHAVYQVCSWLCVKKQIRFRPGTPGHLAAFVPQAVRKRLREVYDYLAARVRHLRHDSAVRECAAFFTCSGHSGHGAC